MNSNENTQANKVYFQFPSFTPAHNKDDFYVFHLRVDTVFGSIRGVVLAPEDVNGDVIEISKNPSIYEIPQRTFRVDFPVQVPVKLHDEIYGAEYPVSQKDRRLVSYLTRTDAMRKARVSVVSSYISNYNIEPSADTEETLYLNGITLSNGLSILDCKPVYMIGVL